MDKEKEIASDAISMAFRKDDVKGLNKVIANGIVAQVIETEKMLIINYFEKKDKTRLTVV